MRALGIVEIQISPDTVSCLWDIAISMQIDLFVFDGSPKSLNKDIVPPSALAIH
jgi:hypothetical protein